MRGKGAVNVAQRLVTGRVASPEVVLLLNLR